MPKLTLAEQAEVLKKIRNSKPWEFTPCNNLWNVPPTEEEIRECHFESAIRKCDGSKERNSILYCQAHHGTACKCWRRFFLSSTEYEEYLTETLVNREFTIPDWGDKIKVVRVSVTDERIELYDDKSTLTLYASYKKIYLIDITVLGTDSRTPKLTLLGGERSEPRSEPVCMLVMDPFEKLGIKLVDEKGIVLRTVGRDVTKKAVCRVGECTICMDREYNGVFIGCGHMGICYECGKSLKRCPFCREESKFIRTYKP